MSSRYGGKIVTDGLILCLDAHDAKSYAGEPTTNVVTYTNLNTGWSKGYQSNITYDEIDPPAGITSQVVGHTRGNNSGYWYSYGNYAPQVPSTVYVVSMYVKTLDSNFRIAFYTADNSETGRYWSSYITVPNDGKWHRVVWDSFTNPSNSQSDSLSFNFFYAGAIDAAGTKTWFCAPQMEAKSYQTPFVAGTRSATNGWVDRTANNNDGTLTNMAGTGTSHYRDGQVIMPVANSYLDFDGTNDIVTISSPSFTTINTHSVCAWVNTDDVTGWRTIIDFDNDEWLLALNNKNFTTYDPTFYSGYYLTAGKWHHLCRTHESGGPVYLYLDGALVYTSTNVSVSKTFSKINIGAGLSVGSSTPNELWAGKIAQVQLYSRKLSTAEVLSNYNTTKSRFS